MPHNITDIMVWNYYPKSSPRPTSDPALLSKAAHGPLSKALLLAKGDLAVRDRDVM